MKREKNVRFWEKNQGSFLLETLSKKNMSMDSMKQQKWIIFEKKKIDSEK